MARLLAWLSIDWSGFAVTGGGFFSWFGPDEFEPWPHGQRPRDPAVLVASGGLCLPVVFGAHDGWRPWERWYKTTVVRLGEFLPPLSVERGGIRTLAPPPGGWSS